MIVSLHTTGHFSRNAAKSQRLIPIASDNQCVASVAALREIKMSSSVVSLSFLHFPFTFIFQF
jgi:hypothetical protein